MLHLLIFAIEEQAPFRCAWIYIVSSRMPYKLESSATLGKDDGQEIKRRWEKRVCWEEDPRYASMPIKEIFLSFCCLFEMEA